MADLWYVTDDRLMVRHWWLIYDTSLMADLWYVTDGRLTIRHWWQTYGTSLMADLWYVTDDRLMIRHRWDLYATDDRLMIRHWWHTYDTPLIDMIRHWWHDTSLMTDFLYLFLVKKMFLKTERLTLKQLTVLPQAEAMGRTQNMLVPLMSGGGNTRS